MPATLTIDERNEFIWKKFQEKIMDVLTRKGKDYGGNVANSNFDRGAAANGISKYQVWNVYFSKHYDSLCNWIRVGKLESEPLDDRIMDLITYLFILWSMTEEDKCTDTTAPGGASTRLPVPIALAAKSAQ